MKYQIKVEYAERKWISFLVNVLDVQNGNYNFTSLVADITKRCPSLSYLTSTTMRLRYLDDEENYVNIDFGDECGFQDMWANAVQVEGREYKRLKIKAGELNSPYMISDATKKSTATKAIQPALTQTSRKHLDMGKVSLDHRYQNFTA